MESNYIYTFNLFYEYSFLFIHFLQYFHILNQVSTDKFDSLIHLYVSNKLILFDQTFILTQIFDYGFHCFKVYECLLMDLIKLTCIILQIRE